MTTREIQEALARLGYDPGPIDGVAGRRTTAAIRALQADAGLTADGIVGPKTTAELQRRLAATADTDPPPCSGETDPPPAGILAPGADRRAAAVRLAAFATNGSKGRGITWPSAMATAGYVADPIHEEVTGGRRLQWEIAKRRGDDWASKGFYSSCGDLPHWMLDRLGCRAPWINRKPWRVGQNISSLESSGCIVRPSAGSRARPQPGDVIMMRGAPGTEHVEVVAAWDDDDSHVVAYAYGQPYGARVRRPISSVRGALMFGPRALIWWLDLDAVPLTEAPRTEDADAWAESNA